MSDLENLADYCHIKARDDQQPGPERVLWAQIAKEIDGYLDEDPAPADLFEATS